MTTVRVSPALFDDRTCHDAASWPRRRSQLMLHTRGDGRGRPNGSSSRRCATSAAHPEHIAGFPGAPTLALTGPRGLVTPGSLFRLSDQLRRCSEWAM